MRIAIIADPVDNQQAGVHVYTREMIHALLANDTTNEYILIRQKRDRQFGEVKQIVVPSIHLPIGLASLRLFFIIPLLCIWYGVDAVIEPAHFGPFNLPRGIKRITVIHDLTPLLMPTMHRWHSAVLQRWFLPSILRRADLIITNSQHTERDVHQLFPFTTAKTIVCYPGVGERFKPSQDVSVLEKLGVKEPYFLYVGTIEPRKNLIALIQAFDLFLNNNPDSHYQLVIAGSMGWKREAFSDALAKMKHRGKVLLTGYVADDMLPTLYTMCNGFFYISWYEGFGFPIAEAMACGAQCVVANNASLPEVAGNAAWYWDEKSNDSLAELMKRVTGSKRNSEVAIEQSKLFRWSVFGKQLSAKITWLWHKPA